MSARTEPETCTCRFCGETYTAAGITNHERYCDENPHAGVHPDDAPDLFEETAGDDEPSADADPDQRVASTDGSGLPSRSTLPDGDIVNQSVSRPSDGESGPEKCPNCGSTDTMPSYEAREKFREEMDAAPPDLLATFDATERYCNGCYSVSGGDLGDDTFCITEGWT